MQTGRHKPSSQQQAGSRVQDRGGCTWGGVGKRRGHGIANTEKASGVTLARVFSYWVITGKRRKLHPLNLRKPDPAAFVHATHLPLPIRQFSLAPGWFPTTDCRKKHYTAKEYNRASSIEVRPELSGSQHIFPAYRYADSFGQTNESPAITWRPLT